MSTHRKWALETRSERERPRTRARDDWPTTEQYGGTCLGLMCLTGIKRVNKWHTVKKKRKEKKRKEKKRKEKKRKEKKRKEKKRKEKKRKEKKRKERKRKEKKGKEKKRKEKKRKEIHIAILLAYYWRRVNLPRRNVC